jgi:UDP-2,3-diacylglucosamine pyrophosphatase LpxH
MKSIACAAVLLLLTADSSRAEDRLPPSPLPHPPAGRTVYFVSDLHMGVGHDPVDPSKWHATEDFRWHTEFSDFLSEINSVREGDGKVDLVLVGDVLELWQHIPGVDECRHSGSNESCTEQEAIKRVERVLDQHAKVFEALGDFVTKNPQNYVTIIPGNHDVAFAFPGVRKLVLDKIAAPAERLRVAPEGYWMSADGKIFAEHGQQIGSDPNQFEGWPTAPFVDKAGVRYLRQPWGEAFVQKIFNDLEGEFPVIDNLAAESLGAKYAAKDLGWVGTAERIGLFGRFILFQQSWSQAAQFLGSGQDAPPDWEIDTIDGSLTTSANRWRFIANSLGKDDAIGNQIEAKAETLPEAPPISKMEIRSACDLRWLRWKAGAGAEADLCPHRGNLGAMAERLRESINPASRSARFRERLDSIRDSLPDGDRPTKDFALYVYGHTHKEHSACTPYAKNATWKPKVINDGAWQRTASEEVFCALIGDQDPKTVLRNLKPEDLPPCYPFVVVLPSGEAGLRYWQQPTGKKGSIKMDCTALPAIPAKCKAKATVGTCPANPD